MSCTNKMALHVFCLRRFHKYLRTSKIDLVFREMIAARGRYIIKWIWLDCRLQTPQRRVALHSNRSPHCIIETSIPLLSPLTRPVVSEMCFHFARFQIVQNREQEGKQ